MSRGRQVQVGQQELRTCFSFLGEPRGPLTSFTFSQNDMCLVFVAFATWAVRTSDLHAPDAWKTGLWAGGVGVGGWCSGVKCRDSDGPSQLLGQQG